MSPTLPTKEEAKRIVEETIKDNALYSKKDFLDVNVFSGEDFYEVGVIYFPAKVNDTIVKTIEEFEREEAADFSALTHFYLELQLRSDVDEGEGVGWKRGDAEGMVFVNRNYKGNGYGTTLVGVIEDISRNLGLTKIQSRFGVDSEERVFLERLGYTFDANGYPSKEL